MNIHSRRGGFSLVELLTVIAIIAILAAIIFPAMAAVKDRARQNQCITNLKNIGMGLELFKTDNRRYPEVLGAHVQSGVRFDSANDPNGLFREYVKSDDIFKCPNSKISSMTDGVTYGKYTYNSTPTVTPYVYNSYEMEIVVPAGGGSMTANPHYTLGWAQETDGTYTFVDYPDTNGQRRSLPPDPSAAGNPKVDEEDYSRQLRFRNPPDNTVVTWCSYHEKPAGASGQIKGDALVLFKGGNVQVIPAAIVERCKWRTRPKS